MFKTTSTAINKHGPAPSQPGSLHLGRHKKHQHRWALKHGPARAAISHLDSIPTPLAMALPGRIHAFWPISHYFVSLVKPSRYIAKQCSQNTCSPLSLASHFQSLALVQTFTRLSNLARNHGCQQPTCSPIANHVSLSLALRPGFMQRLHALHLSLCHPRTAFFPQPTQRCAKEITTHQDTNNITMGLFHHARKALDGLGKEAGKHVGPALGEAWGRMDAFGQEAGKHVGPAVGKAWKHAKSFAHSPNKYRTLGPNALAQALPPRALRLDLP